MMKRLTLGSPAQPKKLVVEFCCGFGWITRREGGRASLLSGTGTITVIGRNEVEGEKTSSFCVLSKVG